MAYLLIPILCFVLLGGLTWVLMGPLAIEEVRKGKADDLDLFLSVLMTAEGIKPYLIMKVPRHVTSVKMTFPGSLVRLEMPLVTRHQQSRRERAIWRFFEISSWTRRYQARTATPIPWNGRSKARPPRPRQS